MKNNGATLFALLCSIVSLAACGQKGPLFLPGTPSKIETAVPAQQPAPVEESAEDSKQETKNPG